MRRAQAVTVVAAAALVAPLLWWGSTASASGTGVTVGGFASDDVLDLSFGAVNQVGYTPAGGGTAPAQAITAGCPGSLAATPAYLTITPSGGSLGIVDNGIGVLGRKDGSGSPCGRADGTAQYLTVGLGSGISSGAKIIRAELDLELKFDAKVDITARRGTTTVATSTFAPNSGSDSGPDSKDGDNFRVIVAPGAVFDSIVLRINSATPGGAFSLEGGADGTAPGPLGEAVGSNGSLFQLADGTLNCGDTDTADQVSGTATTSTMVRLTGGTTATNPDGSSCAPVPYRFDVTGADNVLFQKDLTGQAGARFLWTLRWDPETAAYPLTEMTQIDYLLGEDAGPIQWCDFPSPPVPGSSAVLTKSGATVYPVLPAGLDADGDASNGQQGWCLVEQYSSIATSADDTEGTDRIQVNEVLYGTGDPKTYR